MKCPKCGNDRDVLKCSNCGNVYLAPDCAAELKRLIEKAWKIQIHKMNIAEGAQEVDAHKAANIRRQLLETFKSYLDGDKCPLERLAGEGDWEFDPCDCGCGGTGCHGKAGAK